MILSSCLTWMSTFHSDHILLGSSKNQSYFFLVRLHFFVCKFYFSGFLFSYFYLLPRFSSAAFETPCLLQCVHRSLFQRRKPEHFGSILFDFRVSNSIMLLCLTQPWGLWPNPMWCNALLIHEQFYRPILLPKAQI